VFLPKENITFVSIGVVRQPVLYSFRVLGTTLAPRVFRKDFPKENACEKFHDGAISRPFRRLRAAGTDGTGIIAVFVDVQCD
jgi:hypothetical protein